MNLDPMVRKSLKRAGIGERFHEQSLSEYHDLGRGYAEWVQKHGPEIAASGGMVVFHGLGQHTELRMVARAFHMNGAGVRVKTLRQMMDTMRSDEAREEMNDAPILFLMPAQSEGHENPLRWNIEDAESYIRDRWERGQSVFLYWATDKPMSERDPLVNWWSADFIELLNDHARIVMRDDIAKRGRELAKEAKE